MKYLIGIEILSLIYSLILLFAYIIKKRVKTYETIVYFSMLISICFGFIVELMLNISGLYLFNSHPVLCKIISKIYMSHYVIYFGILFVYLALQDYHYVHRNLEDLKSYQKNVTYYSAILTILLVIGVFVSQTVAHNDGTWYYGTGSTIYFAVASFVFAYFYCIGSTFKNFKRMTSREKIANICMILLFSISGALRLTFQYITINNTIFSAITFILFVTTESPELDSIKKLEVTNDTKRDFISSMSHELKTPLNIIIGLSNNVSNTVNSLKDDMNAINVEALALSEIYSNIIDMNTLDSGKTEINVSEYNVQECITPLASEYSRRLAKRGIELKCFCDAQIPKILIGDSEKLMNATRKLLSNADKFTEKGSITINIGGEYKKDIYNLKIEVKDTGKGIEKNQFDKIFKEFGKSTTDVNSATSGIGLGLTICKIIVYSMGGKILLGSEVGVGSTFVIEVPQKIAGKITEENKIQNVVPASINNSNIPICDQKAMIVDDNLLNLKVGRKILEEVGFSVTDVNSAEECISLLNAGNIYHYIFMDIMMPVKDGVTCMHEIKYLDLATVPKIIALTADTAIGSREKYLNEGFDDYIAKPISKEEVERVIKKED